ncbi:MAG: hypothetical protein HC926_05760 [Synechococcaceae cyanobacterium SM2_3_60]|nr:hypothetical protein [Synechococcaceae cyanobacterium SM2_3_60]
MSWIVQILYETSKNILINNLELILTVVGLVVISLVLLLFAGQGTVSWKAATLVATTVGVLHGFIFWLVRRRQRLVRLAAIAEIRDMLEDIINNKVQIITLSAHMIAKDQNEVILERLERIGSTADLIAETVRHLSSESLSLWQSRYQQTQARIAQEQSVR